MISINCKFGLAELGVKPVSVDLEGESLSHENTECFDKLGEVLAFVIAHIFAEHHQALFTQHTKAECIKKSFGFSAVLFIL